MPTREGESMTDEPSADRSETGGAEHAGFGSGRFGSGEFGSGRTGETDRWRDGTEPSVGRERDEGIPVCEPPRPRPDADGVTVAGVVLAAGVSSRYGDANKLLAERDGEPVVLHATRPLLLAGLDPVVVVVGHQSEAVREAVSSLGVETVPNEQYARGQATSVRAGVRAVRARATPDSVVVALGDMPFVTPDSIEALVDAYASGAGSILAAGYRGERGNPVLFDAAYLDALESLSGDSGARHLVLESGDAVVVETRDPGVRRDVDTPEDLVDSPAEPRPDDETR